MVFCLSKLLLFVEDIWRKTLVRLISATNKQTVKSKMSNSVISRPTLNVSSAMTTPTAEITSTTTTTTTTTVPSIANRNGDMLTTKKRCCRRRTVHFTVFLTVFSTILSLLWIYTLTAEFRRKAFDVTMTKDYVLYNISIDNPDLVAYIRDIQLKTSHQEMVNATQTPEEQFIVNQLQRKREGVYFEYLSRAAKRKICVWRR